MASGKGLLLGMMGRLVLRETVVSALHALNDFQSIELRGDGLRGVAWSPGDKIQMLLPSRDVRTYTPVRWDAAAGVTELLVYLRSGTDPGALWGRSLALGDTCRFVGPQASLRAPADRPLVLFGDETSFAVAQALATAVGPKRFDAVFEVASKTDCDPVLERIGLGDASAVQRLGSRGHLNEVSERLRAALAQRPGAEIVLTGCAQSIQGVRALLRAADDRLGASKAYWSLGKVGLD